MVYVILGTDNAEVTTQGIYDTMDECFDAREQLIETIGRPIVNYQAVCVIKKD